MSDLDAGVQLVKVEIEGMSCVVKIAGTTAGKAVQAFLKLIKAMLKGPINSHYENKADRRAHRKEKKEDRRTRRKANKAYKKLDKIYGAVEMNKFRDKYAGDSISLISLKDEDVDMFLDMCSKEGIAVVRMPDFNEKDGKTQFMTAASTSQIIAFNFERINEYHMKNGTFTEKCGEEITPEEYVQTAPGETPEEKTENFKKQMEEKFPSVDNQKLKDMDLSDDKIMNFMQNAATDEKTIVYGIAGYEKIPLEDSRVVGESKETISLITPENEQLDIDKQLVVNENGKNYVYCSSDNKAKFGMVQAGGRSITAEELKKKLYPEKGGKSISNKLPEEMLKAAENVKDTLKVASKRK